MTVELRRAGISNRRALLTVLAATIGVAGSTDLAVAGLFSAKRPIIAILADDLFLGDAEGHFNGAGTLGIQSRKMSPAVSCVGQFTSSVARGGSGQMQCNDGASGSFQFQRLSVYSGYGVGTFSRGSISFAYGLSVEEAAPYLKLPEGRKLTHNGTELELVYF